MTPTAGQLAALAHDIAVSDTFVVIDNVMGDIPFEKVRNETDASPHVDGVDSYVTSPLLRRNPVTWSMNDTGDTTQIELETAFNTNALFKLNIRGANYSVGTVEDTILEGRLTQFNRVNGPDAAIATINCIFRATGEFVQNGVTIGP